MNTFLFFKIVTCWVLINACVRVRGLVWRSEDNGSGLALPLSISVPWEQFLIESKVELASSKPQGTACLSLQGCKFRHNCGHAQHFTWALENRTRVLVVSEQTLSPIQNPLPQLAEGQDLSLKIWHIITPDPDWSILSFQSNSYPSVKTRVKSMSLQWNEIRPLS